MLFVSAVIYRSVFTIDWRLSPNFRPVMPALIYMVARVLLTSCRCARAAPGTSSARSPATRTAPSSESGPRHDGRQQSPTASPAESSVGGQVSRPVSSGQLSAHKVTGQVTGQVTLQVTGHDTREVGRELLCELNTVH